MAQIGASVLFMALLVVPAVGVKDSRLQQSCGRRVAPAQQAVSAIHEHQTLSRSTMQKVTGCLVKSDHGYSLQIEKDTYPIDTSQDFSRYVNMRITIVGALEHHAESDLSTAGNNVAAKTELHILKIRSVIGDCNSSSK
jgi:hypothetical protein